jgi:trimeric autotransporter adhesin
MKTFISSFFVALTFAILSIGFVPRVQAVSPAPDGGYASGNTAEGTNALFHLTTGTRNTADGYLALFFNTSGYFNTAIGSQALYSNSTGFNNTAVGVDTLWHNTTGTNNAATGLYALLSNTTGHDNTANGYQALYSNTRDSFNTATGSQALYHNRFETQHGGSANTANGYQALYSNTNGSFNTATGVQALNSNTTGQLNTANGFGALASNTNGYQNTATGVQALVSNGTGSGNTANGYNALTVSRAGDDNTADGVYALGNCTTCSGNTALGSGAGGNLFDGDNNIYVANPGVNPESGTVRIGRAGTHTATFIAGISGAAVTGTAVVVNGSGQLGVAPSSARFKDAIKPMDETSEAILALKPVTFRYKREIHGERTTQFGLVAEDVEKVNPDLVARDKEGKPFTVRYDAVNAMLLNEFLKEHRKVEQQDRKLKEQEATISELKQDLQATGARQQKQIEALSAGLQKVSAKLEVNKPRPQIVGYSQ